MNRLVIFEKNGQLVSQPERLTSNPSGNGAQRRKAIKSGWQPSWVKTGQPMPFYGDMRSENDRNFFGFCVEGSTEFGAEIYNENEHVAMMGRDLAAQAVEETLNFEANFGVGVSNTPANCVLCGQSIEVCNAEKAAIYDYNHQEWDYLSDDLLCELEVA